MLAAAAAAAVAGVLLGAGTLGWLTGQDEVQPAELPGDADGGWVRVEGNGLDVPPSGLSAVTEFGGRLVAVGGAGVSETPILTSTDGVVWTPADTPDARNNMFLSGVIRGGPGLIAYGADAYGAVVWTSPNGLTWTAADPTTAAAATDIGTIEVGGPGLIALRGLYGSPGPAGVWTSVDGLTWQSITSGPVGGPGEPLIADIIDRGSGLVGVGSVNHEEVGEQAAVWTSVDGVSWSRVPDDAAVFGSDPGIGMDHVVAGGPGLVTVGSHWPDVIKTSTGLLAVGTTDGDFGADGPSTPAVWVLQQP